MQQYLNSLIKFSPVWVPVVIIAVAGILGNFIVAGAVFILFLVGIKSGISMEFLVVALISAFILGDNFSGPLAYANNLRFIVTAVALVYLFQWNLLRNNPGNAILPFALIAFTISLLFSPVGLPSVLRAVSFWLVALVIFKTIGKLYSENGKRASQLIFIVLVSYFILNLVLFLVPFSMGQFLAGRFKGLTANPNGLGLICLLSYPFVDLFHYRKELRFNRGFFLAVKILILLIVVLTASRTALFSIIIYEVIRYFSKNSILLFFNVLIFIALWIIVDFTDIMGFINVFGLSEYLRAESFTTASGRAEVWQVAWEEVKRNPLFGKGILYDNHFMEEYGSMEIGADRARHWYGVWNSYLSLLLDTGIIGLLAYFYFLIRMYKKTIYKTLALAFLFMVLFSGITESWMASSMNAITPLMFLYWAIQMQPHTTAVKI